jgi:hypothetical protein
MCAAAATAPATFCDWWRAGLQTHSPAQRGASRGRRQGRELKLHGNPAPCSTDGVAYLIAAPADTRGCLLFPVIAIRPPAEADAPALAAIAVAAYQHYVPIIGRPPAPMTADYAPAIPCGQAWVAAVDGEVTGFIILIPRPGYLLLENVAVLPAAQGRGIAVPHVPV